MDSRSLAITTLVFRDFRRAILHRFPFGVFFIVEAEIATVLAITHCVSLQNDRPSFGLSRQPTQPVIATILKNQRDRLRQVVTCFILRPALSVGPRNLGRVGNHPIAVAFEHRRKLVVHLATPAVRFVLAALLLWYGWGKILPGQFGLGVDAIYLPRPVAGLTPMNLLWAFMGASRPYAIFAGLVEFAGGLLLLTRRTAMAGALLSTAALANVLMLDLAYDVNVKATAGVMLTMALFLLAPHATRLGQMFLLNKADPPCRAGTAVHECAY